MPLPFESLTLFMEFTPFELNVTEFSASRDRQQNTHVSMLIYNTKTSSGKLGIIHRYTKRADETCRIASSHVISK